MKNKRIVQLVILTAFLATAIAYWIGSRPTVPLDADEIAAKAALPQVGKTVENFTLPEHDSGAQVNLADQQGKIVVVNFWASWCPPCVEEMPSFLEFAQWAGKELGVKTLALSVDQDPKAIDKLFKEKKFWKTGPLPFTILLDSRAVVASRYGTSKFPETYVLDKNLKLLRKFEGPQNWTSEEIKKWFTEIAKQ